MAFDKNNLIISLNLNRFGSDELINYVVHIICTAGQYEFCFDGRQFKMTVGDSMIIGVQRLLEHKKPSEDFKAICIYVKPEFLEVCTPRNNYGIKGSLSLYSNPIMHLNDEQFDRLKKDFAYIEYRLIHDEHHFQNDVMYCVTQLMFLDFYDVHADAYGEDYVSYQSALLMVGFMQLLERGDYVKNREVGYYADILCVTPKYLSEICKSVSGKAANYWINRFATIHIRRLLQQKKMTFTEISDMFEFSSSAYFSRFVQKNLGDSPSSFRE